MMKNIVLFVLLLFVLPCQASETVLATIGDTKITVSDLKNFSKKAINFKTYLVSPNGPEKLLNIMLEQKLLVQEGQERQIKRPADGQNDDLLYAQTVQNELLQACDQPTESQLKAFYLNTPKLFSTPFYVRTRRISLKAKTDEEIKVAEQKIIEIKKDLESNAIDFITAVEKYSQDDLSKSKAGDLGYIPIVDDSNPIYTQFTMMHIGRYIGPVVEKTGLVNLYQITARREPILDSYDAVKEIVPEEYLKQCNKKRYDSLIDDLKKKWPVQIVVDDVAAAL